jgi:hypothetical protein
LTCDFWAENEEKKCKGKNNNKNFAYYNFCRVHQTLRVTPAMEAGLSDHVWSVEELVSLMPEPEAKKRGPYKKK